MLGGSPKGMSHADVELRSEVADYLDRSVFPAGREILVDAAMSKEAPDRIVALLEQLPAGRQFDNVGDLWRHLS